MPRNKTNKRKTKQRKTKQRKIKQRKTKKTKYKYQRGGSMQPGFYPAFDIDARIINPEDVKYLNYTELAGGASKMAKLIQEAPGESETLKILYVRTQLIMKAVNSGIIKSCPKYPPEFYDILNNYYTKHNLNVQLLNNNWYNVKIKDKIKSNDPVKGLDASILQNHLLYPILGIENPRTNNRIDFVGGIRGLEELERRCKIDSKVAFALYPISIEKLLSVADADKTMPPKSTWFEPNLLSF